jgi:hypothetical protein
MDFYYYYFITFKVRQRGTNSDLKILGLLKNVHGQDILKTFIGM